MNNLPPGVTESMIPGNRPEDEEWDHFWDEYEFWDSLLDWADENNPILCFAMHEATIKMSASGCDRWAQTICQEYEDDLPIEKWFNEWRD